MDTTLKTIQNNALAKMVAGAPAAVMNSIKNASAKTGVNFAYLVQQACTESGLNPCAKAKTSSASGLYQFIEKTWVGMVKKYGAEHGMADLASKIDSKGHISDPVARKQILAMRNDPEKASALAAEFASENQDFLEKNWGGKVGSTELYFAHFMGAGGAAAFLKAHDANPSQQAALIFPQAAKANRNVFYDTSTGRPRTLDEVYNFFDKKFQIKDNTLPAVAEQSLQMAEAQTQIRNFEIPKDDQIASSVFTTAHKPVANYGSLYSPSWHPLLANPVDIILLSQVDLPGGGKDKSSF